MDAFNIGKQKINLKHELRTKFEALIVEPLIILVALVRIQIGQGSSKSGMFFGDPP